MSHVDDDFEHALDDELRTASKFPEAVPSGLTAWDFVSANDNVQVVADVAGDAANSEGDEDSLGGPKNDDVMPTAAEIAAAFATIHRCCEAIERAGH